MGSEDALIDISSKANEALDFISDNDKCDLEKLEYLTEYMRDIVDIIYLYHKDNPNARKLL